MNLAERLGHPHPRGMPRAPMILVEEATDCGAVIEDDLVSRRGGRAGRAGRRLAQTSRKKGLAQERCGTPGHAAAIPRTVGRFQLSCTN